MEKLKAKDYRRQAAELTSNQQGWLALNSLVKIALSEADIVIGGPIELGNIEVQKKLYKKEEINTGMLFKKFNRFGPAFLTYLLVAIYECLWSFLFFIPGIIKSFAYSMTFYLMSDDENLAYNDAITKSRELMKGHKWEYFCLNLSYIGWAILSGLTFGILSLWVIPRIDMAQYLFYLHITGQDTVVKNETVEEK